MEGNRQSSDEEFSLNPWSLALFYYDMYRDFRLTSKDLECIDNYTGGNIKKAIRYLEKTVKDSERILSQPERIGQIKADFEMLPFLGLCYFKNREVQKATDCWKKYVDIKEPEPETYSKKRHSRHRVILNWKCIFKVGERGEKIVKGSELDNFTEKLLFKETPVTFTFYYKNKFYHVMENKGLSLDKFFDMWDSPSYIKDYHLFLKTAVDALARIHFRGTISLVKLLKDYDLKLYTKDNIYYVNELQERLINRFENLGLEVHGDPTDNFLGDYYEFATKALFKMTSYSFTHGDAHSGNFSVYGFPFDFDDAIIASPLDDLSMLVLSTRTHPNNKLSENKKLGLEKRLLKDYRKFFRWVRHNDDTVTSYYDLSCELDELIGVNNIISFSFKLHYYPKLSRIYDYFLINNALCKMGDHMDFAERFKKVSTKKYIEAAECLRIALSTMEKRSDNVVIRNLKESFEEFIDKIGLKEYLEKCTAHS